MSYFKTDIDTLVSNLSQAVEGRIADMLEREIHKHADKIIKDMAIAMAKDINVSLKHATLHDQFGKSELRLFVERKEIEKEMKVGEIWKK